jgi:hypothetical protein
VLRKCLAARPLFFALFRCAHIGIVVTSVYANCTSYKIAIFNVCQLNICSSNAVVLRNIQYTRAGFVPQKNDFPTLQMNIARNVLFIAG